MGRKLSSGLRGSNPSSWLGKPEHYHYAKPARWVRLKADTTYVSRSVRLQPDVMLSRPNEAEHFVALFCHQRFRRRLQIQSQQGLGIRRPHVEVPIGILHGNAVQRVLMARGVLQRNGF